MGNSMNHNHDDMELSICQLILTSESGRHCYFLSCKAKLLVRALMLSLTVSKESQEICRLVYVLCLQGINWQMSFVVFWDGKH